MTIILFAVSGLSTRKTDGNPLLGPFEPAYGAPPFNLIRHEHYAPAIKAAIAEARSAVDAIVANTDEPSFENTIEALERSGKRLELITSILFNLNHAETDGKLQGIVRKMSPILTDFSNDVQLNTKLFKRVSSVFAKRQSSDLPKEQFTLLEKTYKGFVRSGANLRSDEKKKYRAITRELSELALRFNENVLAETHSVFLHLSKKEELEGLPQSLVDEAKAVAEQKNLKGWVITLDMPMYSAFMKFSARRDLREKMFRFYSSRGFRANEHDNTDIVLRTVELRLQLAQLLGYTSYAQFVLEERMAQSPQKVNEFLESLLEASWPVARVELAEMKKLADDYDGLSHLEKWDWSFYAEKLKNKKYNFNEEELRPYFPLERVKEGAFALANKLYGVRFRRVHGVPVYHPDVETYEVAEDNGDFLALLYLDFFPRTGKSGGAWMTSFRSQQVDKQGNNIRPQISVVTNFTKPVGDKPSLLTFSEVNTFLHEFGHALHGIFANGTYASLTGTSVYRDFVELPSQIMENWTVEKEFLDLFAAHFQTNEKIPLEKVEAIVASRNFLAGYASLRQLGFALVDMAWHSIVEPYRGALPDFELPIMARTELLPVVPGSAFSAAFSHIFAGGYAAGYYSYKWAEVLDADAFSLFKAYGIFHRETANSFRKNILERGGSEHPMELYKRFRGHEPTIDALLHRSGLLV